jgi:hypothetical protein
MKTMRSYFSSCQMWLYFSENASLRIPFGKFDIAFKPCFLTRKDKSSFSVELKKLYLSFNCILTFRLKTYRHQSLHFKLNPNQINIVMSILFKSKFYQNLHPNTQIVFRQRKIKKIIWQDIKATNCC